MLGVRAGFVDEGGSALDRLREGEVGWMVKVEGESLGESGRR